MRGRCRFSTLDHSLVLRSRKSPLIRLHAEPNPLVPNYFVYLMASRSKVLYIGMTNDLARRIVEHKSRQRDGFTARYRADRLVYCESYADVRDAITREKQLTGWVRARKIALIESLNPEWRDLSDDLGSLPPDPSLRSG
jgi:putative endonuclease